MTPKEIVAIWQSLQFNFIDEKSVSDLIRLIESALAERTEQCAKICDGRVNFAESSLKLFANAPAFDRNGMHVKSYSTAVKNEAAFIAAQIRALNQLENKS